MESNVSSHLYLPPSFSYLHTNHPSNHQSFPFSVFHENASPPSSPQLHPSTTHHLSKHDLSNPSSFSKYSQPSNTFLLLLLTPLHLLCDPSSLLFHLSPNLHLKRVQSIDLLRSQCRCLTSIQSHRPYNCFHYFLFQVLTHSFSK